MSEDNAVALIVGGETKVVGLSVGGKLFVFSPSQMNFLLSLQKMRNVNAAALSIGKDEEWGMKFLKSRKFKDYIHSKLEEYSVKNGLTPEYLIAWGKQAMEGKKEWYEGVCRICQFQNVFNMYEYAEAQDDDLKTTMICKSCFSQIDVGYYEEPFKPTREQIEAYKELKSTIIPKIERTHHTFANVDISFESSQGESQ